MSGSSNQTSASIVPPTMDDEPTAIDAIREKIIHILRIYPIVSPSMLQSSLGSSLPPAFWKPILAGLIKEGLIMEDHLFMNAPSGRHQTYTQLRLKGTTTFVTYKG